MDMQVSNLHARVVAHVAAGDIVDLQGFAIDASWIQDLLTGRRMPQAWHQAVTKLQPGYECYVGEEEHAAVHVASSGIHVRNATITGKLNFSFRISPPLPRLCLENCRLLGDGQADGDIMTCLDIRHAHLAELSLRGSRVSHVLASDAVIYGNVDITGLAPLGEWHEQPWPGMTVEEIENMAVTLTSRIEDELRQNRTVDHGLHLEFMAPFNDRGDKMTWPSDCKEHCWCDFARAKVAGHFFADGVCLRIPRRTDLLPGETRRCCIDLSHSHIERSLHLRQQSVLEGSLDIDNAFIEGDVRLESCRLGKGERESALAAQGSRIHGSISMLEADSGPTRIFGRLWMSAMHIAGDFDLAGCLLDGDGEDALIAAGLIVDGSILMRAGFASYGGIWLYGCKVGSELEISRAIVLPTCKQARFPMAIAGYELRVAGQIQMYCNILIGMVDLRGAVCETLQDDVSGYQGAWPIRFDGFKYGRVEYLGLYGRYTDSKPRDINSFWKDHEVLLEREVPFRPQPYMHMAKILSQHGFERHARKVFVSMLDRECKGLRPTFLPTAKKVRTTPSLLFKHMIVDYPLEQLGYRGRQVFGLCFGYGLLPSRAIVTLFSSLIIGWCMFALMENRGMLAIAQQAVAQELSIDGKKLGVLKKDGVNGQFIESVYCGAQIRTSLYALDVFIPLIDLHEEEKCEIGEVDGDYRWRSASNKALDFEEMAYRVFKAVYAIVGGIFTSLALLTFSGIIRNRMIHQD